MKDEIKEILEKFNKEVEKAELTRNPYSNEDKKFKHILVSLSEEHFNIFKDTLDYITNLQEENEHLDKVNCHLRKNINSNIYKSRNEKAIELLKEAGCYDEETKTFCDDVWEELPKLLNILQGSDKE